jgi:hypothetical protein
LVLALSARAQVTAFGSPQALFGTNNSPPVSTTFIAQRIPPILLVLTNEQGSSAVTGFVGNVFLSTSPAISTNSLLLAQYTTNNWTGNVTSSVPATSTSVPLYIILQANVGSNNAGATVIVGP